MNRLIFWNLFLISMYSQVQAQTSSPSQSNLVPNDATNFQPSLAVVIGILAIMFSFTFILLIYAKFCHRANPVHNNNHQGTLDGLIRSGSRFSGIDKTVIESLPFFRFSSLKGSKEGLECAVCLSRFEDTEILRLLPKCKHAFHIDCVDQWLEKHSSCPLCRQKVNIDDLSLLTYSHSLRFLWNPSELEDSNIELFVQREESHKGSSRFSIGNSFRKLEKDKKEDELVFIENCEDCDEENGKNMFHKLNHKIIVSDFVFKNRWSNVSSSDLMFLNSEMINSISSDRFSSLDLREEKQKVGTQGMEEGEIMNIKEEMDRKREFESRVSKMKTFDSKTNQSYGPRLLNSSEKRSMSEIIVHPRSRDFSISERIGESSLPQNATKEEKMKRLWYPIARRTAQWFANREKRSHLNTSQTLDV